MLTEERHQHKTQGEQDKPEFIPPVNTLIKTIVTPEDRDEDSRDEQELVIIKLLHKSESNILKPSAIRKKLESDSMKPKR
jgi:hypothetical protein